MIKEGFGNFENLVENFQKLFGNTEETYEERISLYF